MGPRYDPLELARETLPLIADGDRRRYYRFRPARFYGGIATADCLGCSLRCLFCWAWQQVACPDARGGFRAPGEVAGRLKSIARSKGFRQVRISGNEPTLAREHLLEVLRRVPRDLDFILETNGILVGADSTYARDLSEFRNVHVRVGLKGTTPGEFSRVTGADPEGFKLQLAALRRLTEKGVSCHPAVMASFSAPENLQRLMDLLHGMGLEVELEEFAPYGGSEDRLKARGLWPPGPIPGCDDHGTVGDEAR